MNLKGAGVTGAKRSGKFPLSLVKQKTEKAKLFKYFIKHLMIEII